MKKALAVVATAVFASMTLCAQGFAYECDELPLMSSQTQDGMRLALFATQQRLHKTPGWQPGMGEPPVTVAQAVGTVQKWAKGYYNKYDAVAVENVHLMQQSCWNMEPRWLYVIGLTPVMDGNRLSSGGHMAAVLMDGSVVEPREFW